MAVTLVTDAELDRYMSAFGVVVFADHDDDGVSDDEVVNDCKTYATGTILGRLSKRYLPSIIASATIMPEIAAIVTLRTLCLRRGNQPPSSLEGAYHDIVDQGGILDEIVSGKLVLVDADGNPLAQKLGKAMMHSNIVIDRIYTENQQRVITGSSNRVPSQLPRSWDRNLEGIQ